MFYCLGREKMVESLCTFCDKDIDGCRFGIRGAARIIACVRFHRMVDRQPTLSRTGIGLYGYAAASRSIVIYHSIIVIPENVLRRCWTLQNRKKTLYCTYRRSIEIVILAIPLETIAAWLLLLIIAPRGLLHFQFL